MTYYDIIHKMKVYVLYITVSLMTSEFFYLGSINRLNDLFACCTPYMHLAKTDVINS